MAGVYSPEQKSLAKTLMVATGSIDRTLELLGTIWGSEADENGDFEAPSKTPSPRSLSMWKNDPRIPVQEDMLREWSDRARAKVMATSELLTDEMAEALREARERYMGKLNEDGTRESPTGNALDVLNLTKSFGILADKLNGRYGNQPGLAPGVQINGGNVQIVAWAPKELAPPVEATVIDQPGEAA